MNEKGEVPCCGAEWACDNYGEPGHDYLTCPDCLARFETYMRDRAYLKACSSAVALAEAGA